MTKKECEIRLEAVRETMLLIEKNGLWRCPECSHFMFSEAKDYHVCPCCGKEFGYDAKELAATECIWHPEWSCSRLLPYIQVSSGSVSCSSSQPAIVICPESSK